MNTEQKQRWMIPAALAMALIGVVLIVMNTGGKAPRGISGLAFYYDLNTGELFTADATLAPPIDAPSGPLRGSDNQKAGVRAYVFNCDKTNDQGRFIAWIETYPPGAKPVQTSGQNNNSHPLMRHAGGATPLVALPNPDSPSDVRWIGSETPRGIDIIRNIMSACADGSVPVPCVPE